YLVVCFFIVSFMYVDFYGINGFMLSFVEAKSDAFVILLFTNVPCSEMSCACFRLPLVDRAGVVFTVMVSLLLLFSLLISLLVLLLVSLSLSLLFSLLSLLLSLLLLLLLFKGC